MNFEFSQIMDKLSTFDAFMNSPISGKAVIAIVVVIVLIFIVAAINVNFENERREIREANPSAFNTTNMFDDYNQDKKEPAVFLKESFWVCRNCATEFRVPDLRTLTPMVCPSCGSRYADDDEWAAGDDDPETYTCPICGQRIEMLDGMEPDYCPNCGREIEIDDPEE